MANTLLGYFKDGLKREHATTKYFNRDFLAEYVHAYNTRKRNIENGIYFEITDKEYEYNPVFETRFYKENGTSYCTFCELWVAYKEGLKAFEQAEQTAREYLKARKAWNRENGY